MATVRSLIALAALAALSVPVSPSAQNEKLDDLVRRLDQLYRSESSIAEVEMKIVTPNWERTLVMQMWTIGMDKTFIRIHAPRKEKGMGTLRIGNEMWNYLPKVNKVIKVPPSMMASSWMGSDFTNDDLVSQVSFVDDYDHRFTSVESPEEGLVYVESIPHEEVPVVWGSVITAVRESDGLPTWEKYYDEKGRLVRTANLTEPTTFGSRRIPAVYEIVSGTKEGHRTVMRFASAEFDVDVDDDVFTLRNLRSP